MELRVWRSFSSNNSSSYYLVASFDSAARATAAAAELTEFLEAHAEQIDAAMVANDHSDSLEASEAEKALGRRHGFEPEGYLRWGDEGLTNWVPDVTAIGEQVVLFHGYCGGFGKTIQRYFEAVGARADDESRDNPLLSVLMTVPGSGAGELVARELGVYLDGLRDMAVQRDGRVFSDGDNPAPWGQEATRDMEFKCGVPFPAFRDTHQIGFALEISQPGDIGEITRYLEARGIADYRVAIDRAGELERFRAIAAAMCPECESADALRYLDATAFDTPDDQMACATCGGMFAVSPAAS